MIPDNFNHKGVKVPRWLVLEQYSGVPSGRVYAMLSSRLLNRNQAQAVGEDIATRIGRPVIVVMENRGAKKNPTLVHHGYAQRASFHVVGPSHQPLADLYLGARATREVAQAIANEMGFQVQVMANEGIPAGTPLTQHPRRTVHPAYRNPSTFGKIPVPGEVWSHVITGVKCRVIEVSRNRVTYLELGSGNRLIEPVTEFVATHRAPRRSPGVNPRGRKRFGGPGWKLNAHSVAASEGYPYVRGNGRVASDGVTWLSRFTKTSAGTGPAIFVGFHPTTRETVIEHENPSRSPAARERRKRARLKGLTPRRLYRAKRAGQRAKAGHYLSSFVSRQMRATNPKGPIQPYDALGNGITVGAVLIGTGLQNAGRAYTVLAIGKGGRVRLEEHLTGRDFWTFARHYRVDTSSNPRQRDRMAYFNRFTLLLPAQAVADMSGPGAKDEAVKFWAPRIARGIPAASIRAELNEYGAWDPGDLEDDEKNWERLLWIAANNIREEGRTKNPRGGPRIVYNKLLGGWYVVVGPHQTPLNGRFDSKAAAQAWLAGGVEGRKGMQYLRKPNPRGRKDPLGDIPPRPDMKRISALLEESADRLIAMPEFRKDAAAFMLSKRRTWAQFHKLAVRWMRDPETIQEAMRMLYGVRVRRHGDYAELDQVKSRNPRDRGEVDETAATELELFIENDADLYRQQHIPILQNLWRKMKRGAYDHEKAVKLWMYLVESGAKKYTKEFDAPGALWHKVFNIPTREAVARSLAETGRQALENHEYSWQGPRRNPGRRGRGGRAHSARKGPRKARARRNPRGSELDRAHAMFQTWQDRPNARGRVVKMRAPKRVPRYMAGLGTLVELVYESNKYGGKRKLYKHRTKSPRPMLATLDGRDVHIVGGRMVATRDGLIN